MTIDAPSPEVAFAQELENYQLMSRSPFEVTHGFAAIAAREALAEDVAIREGDSSPERQQSFKSWELESRLWHLVTLLYAYRHSESRGTSTTPSKSASLSVHLAAHIESNPKLYEMLLLLDCLKHSMPDVQVPATTNQPAKWTRTRIAIQSKALKDLAGTGSQQFCPELDPDAPLRSSLPIAPTDLELDNENYSVIYKLVLAGQHQEAVDFASATGNFTLALILVGAAQEYHDPLTDPSLDLLEASNESSTDGSADDPQMDLDDSKTDGQGHSDSPLGIQHKYLWLQTVLNLALNPNIPRQEALIYSYLAGSHTSENIKEAEGDWDVCLLLYVNQILSHNLSQCMKDLLPLLRVGGELIDIAMPTPPHTSIESVLNTMLKSPALAAESSNPFRVIIGSVIIDQLQTFLENTYNTLIDLLDDQHILRVVAHLAVLMLMLGLHNNSKIITKIVTKYIVRLAEFGYENLVPVYLTFIPDEQDVRECYSMFLSNITDTSKRLEQLEIFKRLGLAFLEEAEPEQYEHKIQNVLKRTVERVMLETEDHYKVEGDVSIRSESADLFDTKLYRSVDWFYENEMFEDAIKATIVVFRRFLSTGRIKAIKEFGANKNLKALLKDYDLSLHTASLTGGPKLNGLDDSVRDELMQYDQLLNCLKLLEEWESFKSDEGGWRHVEKLVIKTEQEVQEFIKNWFCSKGSQMDNAEYSEMSRAYRAMYVPFFIIELLQILHHLRLHDGRYILQAFHIVSDVANDNENDYLKCFISCGRVGEFVALAGQVAAIAAERSQLVQ